MRNSVLLAFGLVAVMSFTAVAAEKPPQAFVDAMKAIGAAQGGLREAVPAKNYEAIAKHAAATKAAFATIEKWWADRKTEDAVTASKAGVKGATDLEAAAVAKNDEGIAAAQRAIGGTCMGCHTAHRDRLPDGTYEIK